MTETVVSSTHQPTIFKPRNYGVWRPKNPGVRGLKMSGVPGPPGFREPRGGIPSCVFVNFCLFARFPERYSCRRKTLLSGSGNMPLNLVRIQIIRPKRVHGDYPSLEISPGDYALVGYVRNAG